MKRYLRYFRIWFIITGILLIVGIGCKIYTNSLKVDFVRTNTECLTEERVFDYANKMTEEQEESLRAQIAEAEDAIGCDIVIVTLEETLEEYAKSYEAQIGPVEPYQYTMVYADNFYDENKFGYNASYGDGVLLLDNWYREKDGKIHSWMCTTGKAMDHYSSEMIDTTLSLALENVEESPYDAYSLFVSLVESELAQKGEGEPLIPFMFSLPIALLVAVIFYFINHGGRKGSKTVNANTYVGAGQAKMLDQRDIFINRTVTKRVIQTESSSGSSGGGGGGRHISSSGRSHGGGGHSR